MVVKEDVESNFLWLCYVLRRWECYGCVYSVGISCEEHAPVIFKKLACEKHASISLGS